MGAKFSLSFQAPQSTQPKKPQRGGPVAQDQTSFQHKKPQGGRRASRPGPVVPPNQRTEAGQTPRTSRPLNQRTARPVASGRATVRTKHYFHSTAQPQVSLWSGSGLMLWLVVGGRVGGGGRPVTTVKDSSLSGHKRLTRKRGGSSRDRIPKESETLVVRRSPKESVTPESATRDQPRSQSLHPNEPEAHRSSKPPDTVGNAERAGSQRLAAPKVVFQPQGCET